MVVPRPPLRPSYPPSSYCSPHIFQVDRPFRPSTLPVSPQFSTPRNVYSIHCNANFCFSLNARRIHSQVNGVHTSQKFIRRAAAGSHRRGHAGSLMVDSLAIQVITLPVSSLNPILALFAFILLCWGDPVCSRRYRICRRSQTGGWRRKALTGQRLHNGQPRATLHICRLQLPPLHQYHARLHFPSIYPLQRPICPKFLLNCKIRDVKSCLFRLRLPGQPNFNLLPGSSQQHLSPCLSFSSGTCPHEFVQTRLVCANNPF